MSAGRAELLAIEKAAVRGWPALQSAVINGWVWRQTSGGSVRANTVAALPYTGSDVEATITEIERRYRAVGAPPRFTISEVSAPADLDERLAARGYKRGDDHVTMGKQVVAHSMPADAIEVGTTPEPEWMEVYLSGLSLDRRGIAPRILAGLPMPRMYFACRRAGKFVGSGLSIADGSLASVQCMATLPDYQRQGCAQSVLAAIECWAAGQGCSMLYLQTGADNAAAQALYHRCGFFLAGRYHTRVLSHYAEDRRMPTAAQPNLLGVDWSKIPAPQDDGSARHLEGSQIPDLVLPATDGSSVSLGKLSGRTVVYAYPRTGRPGQIALVDNWDMIPGARGCTPQSCAFRDHHAELLTAGAARVFGLSTQDTAYQREVVERLHLPFPILSDDVLALAKALRLPTMEVAGQALLKRFSLILDDGRITKVFYPVFPPDRNAADVLAWLQANPKQ